MFCLTSEQPGCRGPRQSTRNLPNQRRPQPHTRTRSPRRTTLSAPDAAPTSPRAKRSNARQATSHKSAAADQPLAGGKTAHPSGPRHRGPFAAAIGGPCLSGGEGTRSVRRSAVTLPRISPASTHQPAVIGPGEASAAVRYARSRRPPHQPYRPDGRSPCPRRSPAGGVAASSCPCTPASSAFLAKRRRARIDGRSTTRFADPVPLRCACC